GFERRFIFRISRSERKISLRSRKAGKKRDALVDFGASPFASLCIAERARLCTIQTSRLSGNAHHRPTATSRNSGGHRKPARNSGRECGARARTVVSPKPRTGINRSRNPQLHSRKLADQNIVTSAWRTIWTGALFFNNQRRR